MKWWELISCIFAISFCYWVYKKSINNFFKFKKFKLKPVNIIALIIIITITYYNTFYNYSFSKILISFLLLFLFFKIICGEKIKQTFIKTVVIYLIAWIVEIILGLGLAYFSINSLQQFDENIIFKVLFSILMMLIILFISYNKKVIKTVKKICEYMEKTINLGILIFLFLVSLIILTYYLIVSSDIFSNISIAVLISMLSFIFVVVIIQSIQAKKAAEKQEILLNFMKEYEMLIDNERVAKHEMVNNLLILKSIKNKNTKEYENILNEILESYKVRKSYKGLYDLPSGLKGLFYYKIYDMKNKDIEVFMNISNKIIENLDKLSSKFLSKLCKILGSLLDNACEAAEKADNKLVVIDIYKQNEDLIIYIENTMLKSAIDVNKINEKGFSTKGKNRGYGLFLVSNILKETSELELMQKIENEKFISIIKIKK